MVRVKTYINNLDSALSGGIPKRNIILLSGSSGTGKTTLAMQFLFGGAVNENERTIFFSHNEPELKLIQNYKKFSFFDENAMNNENVMIVDLRAALLNDPDAEGVYSPQRMLSFISEHLMKFRPGRIVIDSVTSICNRFETKEDIKKFVFDLGNILILQDCTTFMISEVGPEQRRYSNFGVEESVCDGIFFLEHMRKQNRLRKTLQIVKMRGTVHSEEQYMMNIDQEGVHIFESMDKG